MVSTPPRFAARLAGVGLVVFLANAGLLVLQLVAGKLMSPFVGSSLSTWTVVIAAFLTGIAFGNAIGGRIADRAATPGKLVQFLIFGAIAALWMIALPEILQGTGAYKILELGVRIPVLAFALCFPAGFALSLLTPMAIRICVPDVQHTGSVSGLVFALSTLGCLLGNYLTGFELIPRMELNWIVAAVALLLILTAAVVYAVVRNNPPFEAVAPSSALSPTATPSLPLRLACVIVFACSFAGMTLELTAVRLLAPVLGVSLFTWTGVIGVMLAGTALGNFAGGRLADRGSRSVHPNRLALSLGWSLIFCGLATVLVILAFVVLQNAPIFGIPTEPDEQPSRSFSSFGIIERVLAWTFALFFLPMFGLGLISPQVIRMAVPNVGSVGRVAGTVYAWSIAGAIAGTFATGYVLISSLGVNNTILLAAALPCFVLPLIAVSRVATEAKENGKNITVPLVLESGAMLYALAATLGAVFGGFVLSFQQTRDGSSRDGMVVNALLETNYYTIRIANAEPAIALTPPTMPLQAVAGVNLDPQPQFYRDMILDNLRHSQVNMQDPTYLHYKHEHFQLEIVRQMKERTPEKQSVLVIGGGGYTFPRCTRVLIPTASVDVVEIDPGVTRMAKEKLGLLDEWKIRSIHMDGRQFVAEKSLPGAYDLVTLDAVNDLSVPSHLMTKEFNESVKKTLAPGGVYLVTVIDLVETGQLWKAAAHTLRESFEQVEMVFPTDAFDENDPSHAGRSVIVLYASDAPLDAGKLRAATVKQAGREPNTAIVGRDILEAMLAFDAGLEIRLLPRLNSDDRQKLAARKADWTEYRHLSQLQMAYEGHRDYLIRRQGELDEPKRTADLEEATREERATRDKLSAYRGKWLAYVKPMIELAKANNVTLAKKIILTDQFCPTDNLMMDVFKKR